MNTNAETVQPLATMPAPSTPAQPRPTRASLANIAGGAANAKFMRSLDKVMENIKDPNTDAVKPRIVTLTFTIKPGKTRTDAEIKVACVEKLVTAHVAEGVLFIGRNADTGKAQAYAHDIEQAEMFEREAIEQNEAKEAEFNNRNVTAMPSANQV